MMQSIPEKSGTGRAKIVIKKGRIIKSDHIKLVEMGRAEFIKAWLKIHELDEQFSPGIHSGPNFKMWWTGSR